MRFWRQGWGRVNPVSPSLQLLNPFVNDPSERKCNNVKDSYGFGLRPGGLDILV